MSKCAATAQGVFLLGVLGLAGCKKPDPDATFWTWFAPEEARLATQAAGEDPVSTMKEISARLPQKLIAELAVDHAPGANQTLVITADGDSNGFPAVARLVGAAPKLTRWKVVAFRPARATR